MPDVDLLTSGQFISHRQQNVPVCHLVVLLPSLAHHLDVDLLLLLFAVSGKFKILLRYLARPVGVRVVLGVRVPLVAFIRVAVRLAELHQRHVLERRGRK